MSRFITKAPWLALLSLSLIALGSGGCVDNDQSLTLLSNLSPTDTCAAPTTDTGAGVGRGIWDAGVSALLGKGYIMIPRVKNNLPSSLSAASGGPGTLPPLEMNNVTGTGFDVDVVPDPGQPITSVIQPGTPGLTSFTIPYYTGILTAAGGGISALVEVLNANLASIVVNSGAIKRGVSAASEPYQTVTVRLRMRAIHAGTNLYSNWISLPVQVCVFCLPIKPGEPGISGYNSANGVGLYDCPDPATLDDALVVKTCFPWQDKPATCCVKDRVPLCSKSIPRKGGVVM